MSQLWCFDVLVRATSATEGEANCELVGSFPGDSEKVPKVWMDG